jgi:hypothetical protein
MVIPNIRSAAPKRAFKLIMFVFYMSRQLVNEKVFTFYVSYQGAKYCSMVFIMSTSLLNVISLNGRLKREVFWNYFIKQWIPILPRWNIRNDKTRETIEMINRTNNALECYNCHFNGLLQNVPTLIKFVQLV